MGFLHLVLSTQSDSNLLNKISIFCVVQAAEKLLLPLVSTSHSRGGHAERVAMLQVFSAALRSADQLRGEKGCLDSLSLFYIIFSISFASEMFRVRRLALNSLEVLLIWVAKFGSTSRTGLASRAWQCCVRCLH